MLQGVVENPLLQRVAACCSVLQCVAIVCPLFVIVYHQSQACCSVLQFLAVCCSELQCVAACCSVLKSVADTLSSLVIVCQQM